MVRRRVLGHVFCVGLLVATAARAQSIRDLVARSSLIFTGAVSQLHAATRDVPLEENTLIVKVGEVLDNPGDIARVRGREVTLRFKGASPDKGSSAVFFVNPYSMGETVGADVVATLPAASAAEVAKEAAAFHAEQVETALRQRVVSSILIITGRVEGKPRRAVRPRDELSTTEHDPDWWVVAVRVDSVVRGTAAPGAVIQVAFANNPDPVWADSPKLRTGDSGIFLLHRLDPQDIVKRYNNDVRISRTDELAVIDRLDFLPLSELPRVKKLISENR